jgi:hypothetical protein
MVRHCIITVRLIHHYGSFDALLQLIYCIITVSLYFGINIELNNYINSINKYKKVKLFI